MIRVVVCVAAVGLVGMVVDARLPVRAGAREDTPDDDDDEAGPDS